MLGAHGSLHGEAIVSTKVLRGRARRRSQLSYALVEGCTWMCTGMRLGHLIAEAICVDVRQVVEVEVVNVEDI
jgi:hypothetical protein